MMPTRTNNSAEVKFIPVVATVLVNRLLAAAPDVQTERRRSDGETWETTSVSQGADASAASSVLAVHFKLVRCKAHTTSFDIDTPGVSAVSPVDSFASASNPFA